MRKKDNRQKSRRSIASIVTLCINICLLLVLGVGATYAYFTGTAGTTATGVTGRIILNLSTGYSGETKTLVPGESFLTDITLRTDSGTYVVGMKKVRIVSETDYDPYIEGCTYYYKTVQGVNAEGEKDPYSENRYSVAAICNKNQYDSVCIAYVNAAEKDKEALALYRVQTATAVQDNYNIIKNGLSDSSIENGWEKNNYTGTNMNIAFEVAISISTIEESVMYDKTYGYNILKLTDTEISANSISIKRGGESGAGDETNNGYYADINGNGKYDNGTDTLCQGYLKYELNSTTVYLDGITDTTNNYDIKTTTNSEGENGGDAGFYVDINSNNVKDSGEPIVTGGSYYKKGGEDVYLQFNINNTDWSYENLPYYIGLSELDNSSSEIYNEFVNITSTAENGSFDTSNQAIYVYNTFLTPENGYGKSFNFGDLYLKETTPNLYQNVEFTVHIKIKAIQSENVYVCYKNVEDGTYYKSSTVTLEDFMKASVNTSKAYANVVHETIEYYYSLLGGEANIASKVYETFGTDTVTGIQTFVGATAKPAST